MPQVEMNLGSGPHANWAVFVAVLRFKNKIGENGKKSLWAMCVRPWCQFFNAIEESMGAWCGGNMNPAPVVQCQSSGWPFLANFTNRHPLSAR